MRKADTILARSEVIAMYSGDEPFWKTVGITRIAWGGGPATPDALADFNRRVDTAHANGIRYSGSLDFLTRFGAFIDDEPDFMSALCIDLDDNPIIVPWLTDHKHKGNPAWWFCTNHPLYRAWLERQADLLSQTAVDGLHIDDYLGTAGSIRCGGCFCPHCMSGFAEYLRNNNLAEVDGAFDYGDELRAKGLTAKTLAEDIETAPLGLHFSRFQLEQSKVLVAELQKIAARGRPIFRSANAWVPYARCVHIADQIDGFVCEMELDAEKYQFPGRALLGLKLAEALGKSIAVTASGPDWAHIAESNKPGHARLWIAIAYALGGFFMAPGPRQWAYTPEKGTHWYEPPVAHYAHLYAFARNHPQLLDGFRALSPVALVYDLRGDMEQTAHLCREMADRMVPFDILPAGDGFLGPELRPESIDPYQAVVVGANIDTTHDTGWLDHAEHTRRLIRWRDTDSLARLSRWTLQYPTGGGVWAFPRANGDTVALHIVNRQYDPQVDKIVPAGPLQFLYPQEVVGVPKRAAYFRPGREPVDIVTSPVEDGLSFTLPEVDEWGILLLNT